MDDFVDSSPQRVPLLVHVIVAITPTDGVLVLPLSTPTTHIFGQQTIHRVV